MRSFFSSILLREGKKRPIFQRKKDENIGKPLLLKNRGRRFHSDVIKEILSAFRREPARVFHHGAERRRP